MKSCITAVSYILPENTLTNNDLNMQFPEWSVDKIAAKTGIKSRHIANSDQFSLELAEMTALNLFSKYSIDPNKVDFIILCTQTPKYLIPTNACILQANLGLRNDVGAFDINLGCSGYIYSLSVAQGLLYSKQVRNVLLLTADTYTKLIDPKNKQLKTIFGDGASATFLELSEGEAGLGEFSFYTDGSGFNKLISTMSGVKGLTSGRVYEPDLEMIGPDIFNFTIKTIPNLIEDTLAKNNLKREDITYCIFHQANQYMLNYLREKIGFTEQQFLINMSDCGNTVSTSIPIVLSRLFSSGFTIGEGRILLAGFGVGLSCCATVIV